jgi:hypothetical protein
MMIRTKATFVIIGVVFVIVAATFLANGSFASRSLVETLKSEQVMDTHLADGLICKEVGRLIDSASSLARRFSRQERADRTAGPALPMQELLDRAHDFNGLAVFGPKGVLASTGHSPAPPSIIEDEHVQAAFLGKSTMTTTI